MPSPGPPGQPWPFRAIAPIGGGQQVAVDPAGIVAAAERSGRFPPWRRGYWMARVSAGGRQGATAIVSMLDLLPADRVTRAGWARASGGQDDADAEAEATYQAMYPDTSAPRPPTEPDWVGMTDARNEWLTSVQAAGPADHEVINHESLTVRQDEHAHSDYSGSTHTHVHGHAADRHHSPASPHHAHQPLASADPVTAGIQARAAATAAGDLTPDQIYERLFGPRTGQ